MASSYAPSTICGMSSYSGEKSVDVSNMTEKYQITIEPHSVFTGGTVEVYVLPEGSSQYQRVRKFAGDPSDLILSDPNVISLRGLVINKIKFVPVGTDAGKSFDITVTPIGV